MQKDIRDPVRIGLRGKVKISYPELLLFNIEIKKLG